MALTTISCLYFSWHTLACLLVTTLVRIFVIHALCLKTHSIDTSDTHVDAISNIKSDTNTRLTLVNVIYLEHDTDGINFYKSFEIEKQYNEDTKMISVLKSIDVLMNDQRNNGNEKWDNDSVKD